MQDRGVGRKLIAEGIELLAHRGEAVILVVGNPAYYTRFGFSVAAAEFYPCAYSGPYLMALQMGDDTAPRVGPVTYSDAFDIVS
jgi:putative acetyltransferase